MAQKNAQNEPRLRAGVGQADITPKSGTHVAGAVGLYRPARLAQDPLYAKAIVFESGGRKVCIVSLDLTIVTREWTDRIRQAVARDCGVDPDSVMVHVTQTHSAPSLGHFMVDEEFETPPELEWLRGGDSGYSRFVLEAVGRAVSAADASTQPVRIGSASAIEGRLAFNRRAVMDNGKVCMPGRAWQAPLGPTHIRYIEGPIDPELGVLCVVNDGGRMTAMLLHYTCHPVHVFPKPIVSADWPGAWAEGMRRSYNEACVALVLNGCCGNINPWPPFEPDYADDHRLMGKMLTETARKAVESVEYEDNPAIESRVRRLMLPVREVEPGLLREAEEVLARHPEPFWSEANPRQIDWSWVKAASVMSVHMLRQREPELEYEVQAMRVGQTAIVGLPGEPFVEGQLRIKMASPARRTFVAHCTSHYVGYVPTREAFARGGHEVETRFWSKLTPEALDTIVDGATGLLSEMFG